MLGAQFESSALESMLSPRERDVLALTARGMTNAQIARNLAVTVHAVKFHLASIYRKLGVANRTEATVAFLRASQPTGSSTPGGQPWT
jgi:DNA-binding CsgD family transcriptional regulator